MFSDETKHEGGQPKPSMFDNLSPKKSLQEIRKHETDLNLPLRSSMRKLFTLNEQQSMSSKKQANEVTDSQPTPSKKQVTVKSPVSRQLTTLQRQKSVKQSKGSESMNRQQTIKSKQQSPIALKSQTMKSPLRRIQSELNTGELQKDFQSPYFKSQTMKPLSSRKDDQSRGGASERANKQL